MYIYLSIYLSIYLYYIYIYYIYILYIYIYIYIYIYMYVFVIRILFCWFLYSLYYSRGYIQQWDQWIIKRCLKSQSLSCSVVLLQSLERQTTASCNVWYKEENIHVNIFGRNISNKYGWSDDYQNNCFMDLFENSWNALPS